MGIHPKLRTISETSDDPVIQPLEFEDLKRRAREDSSSDDEQFAADGASSNMFFSSAMGLKRKKGSNSKGPQSLFAKVTWKNAVQKALSKSDDWKDFPFDTIKTEKATRRRYNALKKTWMLDTVYVKMEDERFNFGAMRECFRMKKLSNFANCQDWPKAHNYVAKRYMDPKVPRNTYFDDVKLQMDAKLWGEEFNRHNPPKKVDIFQMVILEFIDREGSPLYHVEHFLEGKYVKYNSNSGFVRSESLRMTPQVFSHFTFERSGHELIVVDIQGVGDLYTDPQIHTAIGTDYGDGNLGTRGMALFFHSHICNNLCRSLGLAQFDLAPSELSAATTILKAQKSCKTVARGTEEHVLLPTVEEKGHMQECIRQRSSSSGYQSNDDCEITDIIDSMDDFEECNLQMDSDTESVEDTFRKATRKPRIRYDSATYYGENTETNEGALNNFKEMVKRKSRSSAVLGEDQHKLLVEQLTKVTNDMEEPILGQIHLNLANYHELHRFTDRSETYNHAAALFHVEYAARCGNLSGIITIAQIHQGLPHDIMPDFELNEEDRSPKVAFDHLQMAANAGDRCAMVSLGKYFDTGNGLPSFQSINWKESVYWYDKAVNKETNDKDDLYDGTRYDPSHHLIARQAEMYLLGLHNLTKDPEKAAEMFTEAADLANSVHDGKLASKYYIKAEEAWGELE